MLNTQLVADFLQEKLNAATQTRKFKIVAEVGEDKGGYIAGILRTIEAPQSSVESYLDVKYVLECTLMVYCARVNKTYIEVNEIVTSVIKALNGTKQDFGNGTGLMTFTEPVPGKFDVNYGAGGEIPLRFMVNITYTESDTVTAADKKWYIDGLQIPFISESVTVETEGYTRKIFSEQYSKTLKTGQTRFYNFEVPQTSEVGKKLQSLILWDSVQGTHTLKYVDGVTYTEENPFTANVILYRSGTVKSQSPNASSLNVTFTDTGVNTEYPRYRMGLVDFPFDMQGEDTRYFNSVAEQQAYFNNLLTFGAPLDVIPAPNLNSINISRQVYPNILNKSMLFLAEKNYAVIEIKKDIHAYPEYLYFFVTNCEIGEGGQVMYDLSLDTVQTYFFKDGAKQLTFSDCLIERAHLNRFEEVNDTTVKFVTDPASKIYNAEDALNFPKRLIKRTKLGLQQTGNAEVDEWLNEHVAYWIYVFFDGDATDPKFGSMGIGSELHYAYQDYIKYPEISSFIRLPYSCCCYPVTKNNAIFYVENNGEKEPWNAATTLMTTIGLNGSVIYAKKISTVPPFNFPTDAFANSFEITDIPPTAEDEETVTTLTFKILDTPPYNIFNIYQSANGTIFTLNIQYIGNINTNKYLLPFNNNIAKADIKNGVDRLKYNPKLNSQNFRELIISASSGDEFAYDIQKLQDNEVQFLYNEPLQPEITKYYLRVNPCGLYEEGTEENYAGLVGSNDTSIAFAVDQYAQFIANNKNFWMQSDMKIVMGTAKSATGVTVSAATGKVGSAVSEGVSGGVGLITSLIDRNMTVDNMKSAPDQLKNANGNIIFNASVTEIGLYVEEWSALDGDLKTAYDFMELYGFAVNAIGNVRDYVNIRKRHNYVKAQLQAITCDSEVLAEKSVMSNMSRQDLRQRFANGIRFWNIDKPDYSEENYENWLDE